MTFCPFRYQGQYHDTETGLYYNRFRYYDPESGGYVSQDPIGLAGGMVLYGYVHDVNGWVDVLGLAKAPRVGSKLPGWKGRVDYSSIKDSNSVDEGKDFTSSQKDKIYALNRASNNGYLVSDEDGRILAVPKKSKSGVKPSPNEAQVDHKHPKSKGGKNSFKNAQVLSRKQNRKKSCST